MPEVKITYGQNYSGKYMRVLESKQDAHTRRGMLELRLTEEIGDTHFPSYGHSIAYTS